MPAKPAEPAQPAEEVPKGVRLIRLECGKANAIDHHLLATLGQALEGALSDGERAVVLTGYDQFFSAGLNLRSLPESREGMFAFVRDFEDGLGRLLTYPLPVVAAINGHAIAGGCVFASACDLRLGAEGSYRIGLSEVDVGLPFPGLALAVMRNTVSERWLTDLVLGARLLSPSEALEVGLLHALLPPERLLGEAVAQAQRLGAKPQPAFRLTKEAMRREWMAGVDAFREETRKQFVDCWFSEEVRERRAAMLQR
jgi:enoyl-CoA hydratase